MFERLLVPLDGSRLAEAALPAAAALAEKLGASVLLLHIIEANPPREVHGERHLTTAEEACAYLDEVKSRAFPAGVPVACHVHTTGSAGVAESIVEHTAELAAGLVVMCTHGRSGLRAMVSGTVAQKVVAGGTVPVLLIRPARDGSAPPFDCRHLLVPLDGAEDHEQAIPAAARLAVACAGELRLVLVVPTLRTLSGEQAASATLLPGATRAVLALAQENAAAYLERHADALRDQGLTVSAGVYWGDVAASIARAAHESHAELIVIGTHGKAGLDAFWARSTAPRLSSRLRIPLLLVPISKDASP